MKEKIGFHNLGAVYYDGANNWYELEFQLQEENKSVFLKVNASDHEKAATEEDYFDSEELVNSLIENADEDELEIK